MSYEENRDRLENTGHYTYHTTKDTQKKRTGLLVALVGLALITGVVSWAVNFMDLQVSLEDHNLTVTLGKTANPQNNAPGVKPMRETGRAEEAHPAKEDGMEIERTPYSAENYPASEEPALSLQQIYEKVSPSVVSVSCVHPEGPVEGTGIIMSQDGYVITNCHVVENAQKIYVTIGGNDRYDAEFVGSDKVTDLAVLKIEAEDLVPAEFGDSDMLRVGDAVVTIGDPLGSRLHGTMTDGIVSAINHDLDLSGRRMTLIQTSATTNPGNPGGPLINCYGQVIGIGTMRLHGFDDSISVEGLGIVIPIVEAKPVLDELVHQGYVSGCPAIGIQGHTIDVHGQMFYHIPAGVAVTGIVEHSGAHAAGLQVNDVIVEFDGMPIASSDDLVLAKSDYETGDMISLTVFRRDQYYTVEIKLMEQIKPDIY